MGTNSSTMNSSSSKSYSGDSGLGLLGETLPDTIKVEHNFTLQIPSKWDRPIRKWVDKCLDISKHYAESFHYIAVGIGSYFFLLGCAKIVAASNSSSNNDSDGSSSSTKRKTKSKTVKSKDSTASNEGSSKTSKTTDASVVTTKSTKSTIPKATIVELATANSEQEA